MFIILLKEKILYNVRKVKNTVNISQTAEEISKHYKDIWKGIYIPLFPIDFNFILIFFLNSFHVSRWSYLLLGDYS